MSTSKTALVIGGNGGIGREACVAFKRHGWQVRALVRRLPTERDGIEWVQGDAMQRADVLAAADGVEVIVHAVNPPGYRQWNTLVLPMLDNSIGAARATGARMVLPGTIYNFGPDAFPLLREDSPQHPCTEKGRIRAEMERRLADASRAGVRTLVLRCGDFVGPHAGNNWFSQGLLRPGKPVTTFRYPADYSHPHAWAYLPDVAETMARLLQNEDRLADFEVFNFGGYWLDGHALADAVRRAAGNPQMALRRFPWWLVAAMAPFIETLREMRKMRYLWKEPVRLDDSKLVAFLDGEPYTPIDEALRTTLLGLGCVK
ncbi:MAG TPA: NAD-dependent epimerase/dehydratase family protein [Dyella sp.]|uniref:NAD-dependent epimerase/dehydratase family protein n=1 Tax=Dyella sp. TaxID=1869338 RepID=UPI002B593852|nr:NAD-dependent epimerase/dehydratase family protein [Dyella sp.]HUB88918.1 NAD-dependent epimerase/dehydratase family protein [Dyella sp.]